jgi:hypothetical protein
VSVYDSISGIVVQPYKGTKKDGLIGFAKGFGRWALGTPLKTSGGKSGPFPR